VSAVRDLCFRVMQLALKDVLFVKLGTLPRTTSGKLKRVVARQELIAGKYVPAESRDTIGGAE